MAQIKEWDRKRLQYVAHPRLQKAVALFSGKAIVELTNENYNHFIGTAMGLYTRKVLKILASSEQGKSK